MKRLIAILLILTSGVAQAEVEWTNVGKLGVGFLSGVLVHEAGHAGIATVQGSSITEYGFDYVKFNEPDPAKRQRIALGGYLTQSIATEVVLQNPDLHENPYALGLMAMGIYVNLSNVVKHYAFHSYNDLAIYQANGGNPDVPAAMMVAYSLFALYRIQHDTKILPYVSNNIIGVSIPF